MKLLKLNIQTHNLEFLTTNKELYEAEGFIFNVINGGARVEIAVPLSYDYLNLLYDWEDKITFSKLERHLVFLSKRVLLIGIGYKTIETIRTSFIYSYEEAIENSDIPFNSIEDIVSAKSYMNNWIEDKWEFDRIFFDSLFNT